MRIFIDSANLADITCYNSDPLITGFTTNATLVKKARAEVQQLVLATTKEVSVEYGTMVVGPNVRYKVTDPSLIDDTGRWNLTAVCTPQQVPARLPFDSIISVFAGRIMDTGRHPANIITLAKRSGAMVLWASTRSVYDITLAETHGCDIITVTPAIYEKYREWNGLPLEEVARRTIEQFEADRVG